MRLVPAPHHGVVAGRPLPFALRASDGRLLLERGAQLPGAAHAAALLQRGVWVTADDAENFERAYRGQLESLVRQEASLGKIAEATPDLEALQPGPDTGEASPLAWERLVGRLHLLLRGRPRQDFVRQLDPIRVDLGALLERAPDRGLFVLIQRAARETERYAAAHAVTVAVMCRLAARVLALPLPEQSTLLRVALTMNLGMIELQDRLATQEKAPDASQRRAIDAHAETSARQLADLGVQDPVWLEAVRQHHGSPAGPLAPRTPADRIARIVHQADVYAARMSVRQHRPASSTAAASRSAYLDEAQQPDEAGAALLKAVGLYPPGSLVQLVSGEVGVVLRRGPAADKPVVAALVSKKGLPLGVPALRHTRQPASAVQRALPPHELKMRLDVEALLALA